MKRISLFIIISILMTSYVSQAQNIQGSWHGELDLVSQKLALVFHFDKDNSGKDLVKLDIPAQSAIGVPVAIQYLSKDSVSLQVPIVNLAYTGKLTGNAIKGTFTQNGMSLPLDLTPGGQVLPNRPQEPNAPFPYQTEEVSFTNNKANAVFSGTLTYPVGYTEGL